MEIFDDFIFIFQFFLQATTTIQGAAAPADAPSPQPSPPMGAREAYPENNRRLIILACHTRIFRDLISERTYVRCYDFLRERVRLFRTASIRIFVGLLSLSFLASASLSQRYSLPSSLSVTFGF